MIDMRELMREALKDRARQFLLGIGIVVGVFVTMSVGFIVFSYAVLCAIHFLEWWGVM